MKFQQSSISKPGAFHYEFNSCVATREEEEKDYDKSIIYFYFVQVCDVLLLVLTKMSNIKKNGSLSSLFDVE